MVITASTLINPGLGDQTETLVLDPNGDGGDPSCGIASPLFTRGGGFVGIAVTTVANPPRNRAANGRGYRASDCHPSGSGRGARAIGLLSRALRLTHNRSWACPGRMASYVPKIPLWHDALPAHSSVARACSSQDAHPTDRYDHQIFVASLGFVSSR